MKAGSLIKRLIPREERFHELLARDTQNLVQAARLFSQIAQGTDLGARRSLAADLKAVEHDGDLLTKQIFEALNQSFITPLDRDDIRSIANGLDNVLDDLEGVAQYLVILELSESPSALRQFAQILLVMAEEIERATAQLWDLSNKKQIQASIVRISELENQADALYNSVIAELFRSESRNPVEIMKWKEVYDGLEDACDECREYSHVLGNVVLKNS
jgi:predicted phosphate transport protein (TIGR00153 family)